MLFPHETLQAVLAPSKQYAPGASVLSPGILRTSRHTPSDIPQGAPSIFFRFPRNSTYTRISSPKSRPRQALLSHTFKKTANNVLRLRTVDLTLLRSVLASESACERVWSSRLRFRQSRHRRTMESCTSRSRKIYPCSGSTSRTYNIAYL